MASILKVDTIQDQDGNNIINESANTITIGASGDTITIPSGATFASVGIDDNATSTAITIDNSERVGIGTSSPDAMLHIHDDGASTSTHSYTKLHIENDDHSALQFSGIGEQWIWFSDDTTATPVGGITYYHSGQYMAFRAEGSERMRIDSSGNVGIGVSSPLAKLHVDTSNSGVTPNAYADDLFIESSGNTGLTIGSGTSSYSSIYFANSTDNDKARIEVVHSDNSMRFTNNASERMRIDSSGRVGIGDTPSSGEALLINNSNSYLSIKNATQMGIRLYGDDTNVLYSYDLSADTVTSGIAFGATAGTIHFYTNGIVGQERMRIDSSGDAHVGCTSHQASASSGTGGSTLGSIKVSADTDVCHYFNRIGSDGTLAEFRKDGSAVGSIGTLVSGSDSTFHITGNIGTGIRFYNAGFAAVNENGTYIDNSRDIGSATIRWDDVYATNGTIQTSDQNEKQSIQSLTTDEMNVAKRLSPLIKTFKWNSSVEEKGDNARTHTGIIAQDVQQAFTDEGLDASNYALFISSTWWEKEISVEATEEQEAHTYIDYKEEATDGYTERTRLGVRYPELLSFIQAYNDQRFTELEARITALETQP